MTKLSINDRIVEVPEGTSILDAATSADIKIPTLCYYPDLNHTGACRICVVEVEGAKGLQASCITPVMPDMVVRTNTARVRNARKVLYELIMSDHPADCLQCARNTNCELQDLGDVLQVRTNRFTGARSKDFIDDSSAAIVLDTGKCILCRRCVAMCNEVQHVGALNAQDRGFATVISPGVGLTFDTAVCSLCGQCTTVCPVDALKEADSTVAVWQLLADPGQKIIVQTAPAVRAALGEEFGLEPGTLVTGKMVSALRELGFDYVFDTNFAADLTIIEEGYEFLSRVVALFRAKGAVTDEQLEALGLVTPLPAPVFPMITSCSPGWIKYVEHFYGAELDHLSTCKSPHTMLGALSKAWFAKQESLDVARTKVVSVMPCTAKKFEITRPEMVNEGFPNVDAVLTTREIARMIKEAGIDFVALPDGAFDNPMGTSSGAADIFGFSGGVMEAALRTVYELITGRPLPFDGLHVAPIEGLDRVKRATFTLTDVKPEWSFLEGVEVPVAVTNGLWGAGQLMDEVAAGTSPYLFIEVMGCPGGCIGGGGQPRPATVEVKTKRLRALLREDDSKELRKSHDNPDIAALYEAFLGKPNGHHSHELLHTSYTPRNRT